jgi:hypothetical protein
VHSQTPVLMVSGSLEAINGRADHLDLYENPTNHNTTTRNVEYFNAKPKAESHRPTVT